MKNFSKKDEDTKVNFKLGSGKTYDAVCADCKIEFPEMKELYPDGLPIPLKCDKCKKQENDNARMKVFVDRLKDIHKDIPEMYWPHIKFDLTLERYKKTKEFFSSHDFWGIMYFGNTGTGKSTMAYELLAKAFVFMGIRGQFIEAPRLAKRLRSDAMNGKNPEEQFKFYANTEFLVIDDFLTEQDDHRDKGLIESLCSEREKFFRKTIFTTNATPEKIFEEENGYSERMKGRMKKIKKFQKTGKDFRSS